MRATRHAEYFIDEAGDPILFNRQRQVTVGVEGCSRYFALGMTWVLAPRLLEAALRQLRSELLADPYFRHVPSMQPARRKTALAFHAKDDIPEVRREVFRLLQSHPLQFFALVRDKTSLVLEVRRRNACDTAYRYQPNALYDSLVSQLMRHRLSRDRSCSLCFARRGARDRTQAFVTAVAVTRRRRVRARSTHTEDALAIGTATPVSAPCLQATDYLLWALQRLVERGDERYLTYVWPCVRLVHDLDDVRARDCGEFYTGRRMLTQESFAERRQRI